MTALLALTNVVKSRELAGQRVRVLDEVSLQLNAGELVAVAGLRSRGKSTLLRIAAGMEEPDSGTVAFAGRDLWSLSDRDHSRVLREDIGIAGQVGPQIRLRVLNYVAAPLLVSRRRHRRREVYRHAAQVLERVGLQTNHDAMWADLSTWDRALVEVAQAIVRDPRMLLIDDVVDGLGMLETASVTRLLRRFAEESNMAVLMTVSEAEAALSAHRIFRLAAGRLRPFATESANVVHLRSVRHRRLLDALDSTQDAG